MGASATMADANCGQWEPSTATRSTLRPKMSSNVKSEPCLGEEIRGEVEFGGIVGQSAALGRVLQLVETVAHTESTVLLLGERDRHRKRAHCARHSRSQPPEGEAIG